MKSKNAPFPLAILAASTEKVGFASLALDTTVSDDGWCQLLPAGHFSAIDGRPTDVDGGKWFIDATIAQRLIDTALAANNDLVLDYEHQTLNSDKNGQPAPAAGWFKQMQWREDSGLWIKVDWTATARDYIKNGEYRYLSAVFPYDTATGAPLMIHSAALVNRAGLDGLKVASLSAAVSLPSHTTDKTSTQENSVMNEKLRKLLAKLGIEVAEGAECTAEQATAALSALDELNIVATKVEGLNTQITALKADTSTDLSKFVPAATYNALVIEMTSLKASDAENSAKQLIEAAQQSGKVMAVEVDYLNSFAAQQGIAALKTMLDQRASVAALKGKQTTEIPPGDSDASVASLSVDDKEAARLLGKTDKEFAALKAAHA